MKSKQAILFCLLLLIFSQLSLFSQEEKTLDSLKKTQEILEEAKVQSEKEDIEVTVRSVDISHFPQVTIMIEAFNKLAQPFDTLTVDMLSVEEEGATKKILKVEKIPVAQNQPVDFIFLIDKTGSMQKIIDNVKANVVTFTNSLVKRGIDYRLGLILFSDEIEKVYDPTPNPNDFLEWLSVVKARGGGDEKENALEAMERTITMKWRDEASKVCVVITDAPYHQANEDGFGITNQTTEKIIESFQKNQIRLFSIVPPRLPNYKLISSKTRGTFYDIDHAFSTILDNFSTQLTNLFNVTYLSNSKTIPDSIEIALFSADRKQLVKKTIPIVELGRKLIIENLLFGTASSVLPDEVIELDVLADFMKKKPTMSVTIEGHTDNIGSNLVNDNLSLNRANTVREYLIKRGVEANRIESKGYGKRKPIATNLNEFGRRLNRRTEIVINSK